MEQRKQARGRHQRFIGSWRGSTARTCPSSRLGTAAGCHATASALSSCSVPTATRCAVTSMAGSGTASQDGQIELGASVGDAALALGCATLPKVAICVQASCFALSETCRGRSRGFPTCSPQLKGRRKRESALSARHEALRLPRVLCRTISHRRG